MKNVMNLTPEEKIISEVDKLLEEIKTKDLAISGNEPDDTEQDNYIRKIEEKGLEIWIDLPDIDIKRGLIYKFRKIGLLKVLDYGKSDLGHTAEWFIFKTKQPNFDNFYNKWQEIKENPWIPTQDRPKKLVQFLNTGKLEEKYLKQKSGQEKSFIQKEIDKRAEKAREEKKLKREIIEEIQLNRTKEKQTKVAGIELPNDPKAIEEYLNILNRIEQQRQKTSIRKPVAFPIPKGVPFPEQETSMLEKLEQDGLIKITQKTIPFIDPLGLDPYENIETIRAIEIPNLDKFKDYRAKLSKLKAQLSKSRKKRKIYAKIRDKKITKRLAKEKERVLAITIATDHRLVRDLWLNTKRVLDNIYKLLVSLANEQQTISLNPNTLPIEQKRLFTSVLKDMLKNGVVDYHRNHNRIVITSEPYRKFLNGENIIIKNRYCFEDYKKEISELYNFIEKDGRVRFPEVYSFSTKARAKEIGRQFEKLGEKQEKSPLQKEIKRRSEKTRKKEEFKKEIIEEIESKKTQDSKRPFCIIENNFGYLKFDKYGEKIKIGTPKSRHFRLLEYLLELFGKAKTTEAVYEWIKLPKDKKDSDLSGWDNYKKHNRQVIIIQNTIKELQKDNKLRGKLAFEFDDTKTKIWIKFLE